MPHSIEYKDDMSLSLEHQPFFGPVHDDSTASFV